MNGNVLYYQLCYYVLEFIKNVQVFKYVQCIFRIAPHNNTNVTILDVCLGGGDYAYSAAYSQYSSAPYSGYGYGAATSGLLSK